MSVLRNHYVELGSYLVTSLKLKIFMYDSFGITTLNSLNTHTELCSDMSTISMHLA